jgi:hypothetical protein
LLQIKDRARSGKRARNARLGPFLQGRVAEAPGSRTHNVPSNSLILIDV